MAFTIKHGVLVDPEMEKEIADVLKRKGNIAFTVFAREAFRHQLQIEKAMDRAVEKPIEKLSKG